MSDPQPASPGAPSGLHQREKRSIRYVVQAALGGGFFQPAEFSGLDSARLHAWALALDGKSVEIAKAHFDITKLPTRQLGATVIERWDERSAFILLNSEIGSR